MSNLAPLVTASAVTMTSLELVEVINSERGEAGAKLAHSDLLKKVPQVLGRDAGNFSSVYRGGNGQERPCYRFPKREACLMAMSYSYELQAKVFDRMSELETVTAGGRFYVPQTMPEALRLAADLADQNKVLTEQVETMTPKVEALTRIALADGSMCIQSAAKHLQIQPKKLFLWLSEHEWIYRRAGGTGWLGYQSRIQSGLLEHKVTTVERSDGSEKMVEQCRITPRGLSKLAELLNEKEAA
ncbi:phage antirepressor KilAC domain-containing protein [Variovorax atrisoli]|uniref:phage antirepressor KilAC domain-containing protein n=1 Tax=Variovorax atrisoli TaxID=3394203 RepID=UPI00160D89A1|nr:phage antirepressor KilAC domain-containing protein [Variovorax sp. BK613]MBB3639833.1 phage antirepressor YoqD-like protein [Variovorax sp. BK613]